MLYTLLKYTHFLEERVQCMNNEGVKGWAKEQEQMLAAF